MSSQVTARAPLAVSPPNEAGRYVSEDLYWEKYYEFSDIHYEWNNGYLEEKPASDYLTYQIYAWFVELLSHFLRVEPIAKMVGLEMGFRMALPGRVVIRKPDLGVARNDNAVPLEPLDRSFHGVFDLCIEALSDSTQGERERDEVTKKREYATGGVPEYYILHHDEDRLGFYTLTGNGIYRPMPSGDGIVRSRILPGFQFRKTDLLLRANLSSLRDDPIYRGFLFPDWRRAEQARDQAARERDQEVQLRRQAEQERDATLQARVDAVANLDTMGLLPEQIARALGLDIIAVRDLLARGNGEQG